MNGNAPQPTDTPQETTATERRVAFERLRERTDELELLISGISLLSLISLPGWLFERWSEAELHYEGMRHVLLTVGYQFASGLCYAMATAFLLHLAVRGYWVGLIGLKATFPGGIRWTSLRNSGPITRGYYQRIVVDLDTAIDAADRFASVVFALVSLVVLSVLWVAASLAILFAVTVAVVEGLGLPERTGMIVFYVYMGLLMGTSLLIGLFDLLPARWQRDRPPAPGALRQAIVERLLRLLGMFSPQRLILPVQLSLQSNLSRRAFFLGFTVMVFITSLASVVPITLARQFAPFGSYTYLEAKQVGLRSAFYENLRGEHDRLLRLPLIPSDMVADSQLRVFLPYLPRRDNPVMRAAGCAPSPDSKGAPGCLAALWQVQLDQRPVAMTEFITTERRQLGIRGLQAYLPLAGLAPGRHELVVTWNPHGSEAGDDELDEPVEYRIPFWFAPPYQLDLPAAAEDAAPAG